MTKLYELMSLDLLEQEWRDGYVRARKHPRDPDLFILNYSEKTQFEKRWNEVTRQSRGLIYRRKSFEVLARPFEKFFNLGEHEPGTFHPDATVEVTDKMDGSLGILYPDPDGRWAIATRGSFESEQAIHATDVLRNKYDGWEPDPDVTYLFEIVYPGNRIVLDYGDQDDLVLLGVRHRFGHSWGPRFRGINSWPGPRTKVFPAKTFRQALELADRPNAEGIVIHLPVSDTRVKVKQDDYVRLHKLVTGLNERAVWEHLAENDGTYGNLMIAVPDEFHSWVEQVADTFLDDFEELQGYAHDVYGAILVVLERAFGREMDPTDRDMRKAFAEEAREMTHSGLLFQMLDGRDISPAIWKTLKPKGETPSLLNRSEDNA